MSANHLKLNLRSLFVLLVILALVLALVVQHQRSSVRVRVLRAALAEAQAICAAHERMQSLLGDQGIFILRTVTRVEVLSVGRGAGYPRTPTGVFLDKAAVARLCMALLDPHNYVHSNADDLPEPQAGFRFRGASAEFDILVSLEGSNATSPHQDLFFIISDEDSKSEHAVSVCMYSNLLQGLLVDAISLGKADK